MLHNKLSSNDSPTTASPDSPPRNSPFIVDRSSPLLRAFALWHFPHFDASNGWIFDSKTKTSSFAARVFAGKPAISQAAKAMSDKVRDRVMKHPFSGRWRESGACKHVPTSTILTGLGGGVKFYGQALGRRVLDTDDLPDFLFDGVTPHNMAVQIQRPW